LGGVGSLVSIGKIGRPHGIRGEVKVIPLTDWPERFQQVQSVYLEPEGEAGVWVEIERAQVRGDRIILKFAGIEERDQAERIRGRIIQVCEESLPLPEGYFHVFRLIGMDVKSSAGEKIGPIVDVLRMPSHDIYVVDSNGREIMIPAVKKYVKRVDIENNVMIVEAIEGILE